MIYENDGIQTTNQEVVVGGKYQYREGDPTLIVNVELVEDNSRETRLKFMFKVIECNLPVLSPGQIFGANLPHPQTNGRWILKDLEAIN